MSQLATVTLAASPWGYRTVAVELTVRSSRTMEESVLMLMAALAPVWLFRFSVPFLMVRAVAASPDFSRTTEVLVPLTVSALLLTSMVTVLPVTAF